LKKILGLYKIDRYSSIKRNTTLTKPEILSVYRVETAKAFWQWLVFGVAEGRLLV
jgi:hypothetical protein